MGAIGRRAYTSPVATATASADPISARTVWTAPATRASGVPQSAQSVADEPAAARVVSRRVVQLVVVVERRFGFLAELVPVQTDVGGILDLLPASRRTTVELGASRLTGSSFSPS